MRQRFHLPRRWKRSQESTSQEQRKTKKPNSQKAEELARQEIGQQQIIKEVLCNSEVRDTVLSTAEMEALPMVGRKPWPKSLSKPGRNKQGRKADVDGNAASRAMTLPLSPDPSMLKFDTDNKHSKENMLVTWLPYSSIDVVFNNENVYANHQNHNPAFISYDFMDSRPADVPKSKWHAKWMRFVEEDDTEDSLKIKPVTPSVKLPPAMSSSSVNTLRVSLLDELKQTVSLNRQNAGMDTVWAHHPDFVESIGLYLDIWESWLQLDIDMEPVHNIFRSEADEYKTGLFTREEPPTVSSGGPDKPDTTISGQDDADGPDDDNGLDEDDEAPDGEAYFNKFMRRTFGEDFKRRYCNIYGTPYSVDENPILSNQMDILRTLRDKVESFRGSKFQTLVKRGYVFDGFPVHFTEPDPEVVRLRLMRLEEFQECLTDGNDDIQHTIVCKLYPLPAKLLSGWVYIGTQKPISMNDE